MSFPLPDSDDNSTLSVWFTLDLAILGAKHLSHFGKLIGTSSSLLVLLKEKTEH